MIRYSIKVSEKYINSFGFQSKIQIFSQPNISLKNYKTKLLTLPKPPKISVPIILQQSYSVFLRESFSDEKTTPEIENIERFSA